MKKALFLALALVLVFAMAAPAFAVDIDPIDASATNTSLVTLTVPHVLVLHGPGDIAFGSVQPNAPFKKLASFSVDSNEAWSAAASIPDGVLSGVDDNGAAATIPVSVFLSVSGGAAGLGVPGQLAVGGLTSWTTVPADYSGVLTLSATQN